MGLSQREKILVFVAMAILIPLALFRFVLMPIQKRQQDLATGIVSLKNQITQAEVLGQEYRYLQKNTKTQSVSISKQIDSLLRRNRLKARSKITLEEKPGGGQRLVLKLDELNLTELTNIIYQIENSKPVVMIDNIDVNLSFKNKELLRVSMALTSN